MNNIVSKCLSKTNIFISLFCGVFCYFIIVLIAPQYHDYAMLFALLFTLGLVMVLPIVLYLDERKYKDIDQSVEGEILAKEKVNINCSGTVRNGYFILTADSIYLFTRDKKPYLQVRILKESIKKICVSNYSNLYIVISESVFYSLTSGKCKSFIQAMQEYEWI